jgi:hypothetical protein
MNIKRSASTMILSTPKVDSQVAMFLLIFSLWKKKNIYEPP